MFTLQRLISDLAEVERNHHILDSEKAENDVEHSYSVALLCWYIYDKLKLKLDLSKILKYALIHDFVEVYAGDVNTFATPKDRNKKLEDESLALEKLTKKLSGFNDMSNLLANYESKNDEESIFVWTVDKMQSLIPADLDNWRPYKKINVAFDTFSKKHQEHIDSSSVYCKEIFTQLLKYCKTTYYDQPNDI